MKKVRSIVFRYITAADYFNINKPSGTEIGGGGQSYIDFPTDSISLTNWENFFTGTPGVSRTMRTQGPCWSFNINNTGIAESQNLVIYRRRAQSISIASQKLFSLRSNRVKAWHPENGFPMPTNPLLRSSLPGNLAIYIVKTTDGEYWAGWFMDFSPCKDTDTHDYLNPLVNKLGGDGYAGILEVPSSDILYFDENDARTPFALPDLMEVERLKLKKLAEKVKISKIKAKKKKVSKPKYAKIIKKEHIRKPRTEKQIIEELFTDDQTGVEGLVPEKVEIVQKIIKRNTKAVKDLKALYGGKCQITGDRFTFKKKDGSLYSEAHHLIPIGNDGADSIFNIVILSPLIHKMLHYADVEDINLADIREDNTLEITINGKPFTITWHPKHAELVKKHIEVTQE